jgi:hypothetical protein
MELVVQQLMMKEVLHRPSKPSIHSSAQANRRHIDDWYSLATICSLVSAKRRERFSIYYISKMSHIVLYCSQVVSSTMIMWYVLFQIHATAAISKNSHNALK